MKNEVYQPTATDTLTGDDEDGDAKGTYAWRGLYTVSIHLCSSFSFTFFL